jgi:hypothetical protein
MDRASHDATARAVEQPLAAMTDNLTFILGELPKLTLADDVRNSVAIACERFRAVIMEERSRVLATLQSRPPEIDAADPFPALRLRLEGEMRAYDALVHEMRDHSGRSVVLNVLLNESGASILSALNDLGEGPPRVG